MPALCALLILLSFLIAVIATPLVRRLSLRFNALDTAPIPGQIKAAPRRVPNTGGIAIFLAITLPILVGLLLVASIDAASLPLEGLHKHIPGILEQTPLALTLVAALAVLHTLGLIDDRRPLSPWLKLAVMAVPAFAVPILSDTRLLTMLDAHVGGPWLSIVITALWLLVVTNAMNFMDNMDGLCAGVAVVAGSIFLSAAAMNGQLFVAACLSLLVGACLGFLVFNAPRRGKVGGGGGAGGATIFMGDGGSLVLGFLLAFLTIRTTYATDSATPSLREFVNTHWYSILTPLIVLAVPLYDFTSVVLIRISQGRSPFVGDLQHLSHRLVQHNLSRRAAVAVICGFTAVTGLGAVYLRDASAHHALLIGAQTALMLCVLATFEYASSRST